MINHRIYKTHTVDAVLEDNAIPVIPEHYPFITLPPDYRRFDFANVRRSRMLLSAISNTICQYAANDIDKIFKLAQFTANIENIFPSIQHPASKGYYKTPDDFIWGGTEEFVIAKGSDWCAEAARVFCALCQINMIPSRIVYIYSQNDGHVISECFIDSAWVLVDPLAAKIYMDEKEGYSDIVKMMSSGKDFLERSVKNHEGYYVNSAFFKYAFISEYYLAESEKYDYGLSFCNDFYRKHLDPIWNK